MKRAFALFLSLLLAGPVLARGEKRSSLPEVFHITYETIERIQDGKRSFVSKEHIATCQRTVDEEINALADAFDQSIAPLLQPDKDANPRRNSRLDIHVLHSVSGQSTMSFLVLARESYRRAQRQSPFACRTYDMETGEPIFLTDIFPDDSEAWDVLAEAVEGALSAYFPKERPNEAALASLCSRTALETANFTLGPVCLSLHYEARALYPEHPSLMRVSVPYTALRGMMTELGERCTDNSMYKMVALTFDDGPAYTTTAALLNHLRHSGVRATFFLVGDRIGEYEDIVLRENDEAHSLQSHHFKHTDTTKSTPGRIQAYTQRFDETLSSLTGLSPRMLRAPYGLYEPFIQARVALPMIQWDVDTKDWTGKSSAAILKTVKKETKDGSIILMHDIVEETPESAKLVAQWLTKEGYLCVTVEELFMHFGQPLEAYRCYYSAQPNPEAYP